MRSGIEAEVAHLQLHRPFLSPTTKQRADSRDEHHEGEGLGEEIVRARIERPHLVPRSILGRQHQDGRPVAGVPEVRANFVAVAAGKHDVEHDRVVLALLGEPLPVGAVESDIDGVALGLEAPLDRGRQPLFVFDHENARHRVISILKCR